jgi:hypothetical protein
MRLRPLALLTVLIAVLALPAGASAAALVGISENNSQMFADPNFQALGVKTTRLVMAYDAATAATKGDNELSDRVVPYLDNAKAAGTDVLVAFEHSRGDATICSKKRNFNKPACALPSVKTYSANIAAFLAARPDVHTIAPWNEANHFTQPTSRNAKRAAQFTDAAAKVCKQLGRKCTIVAADVLDQADDPAAKKPKFKATAKWIKTFRRSLKTKRSVCGIHNYSDVNRFRTVGLKALEKALRCKQYWLTETGGLFDFGSFWTAKTKKAGKCKTASACQVKATKFLFKTVKRDRKVKRVYVYTWFSGDQPRFDAGLVAGTAGGGATVPRPAYAVVAGHI